MKKVILKLSSKTKAKTNKELFLSESSIKVGDLEYERKLRKRLTDLRRAKNLVDKGIETAKKENNNDLVNILTEKSQEIQKLIDEVNTDLIDQENSLNDNSGLENEVEDEEDSENNEDEEIDSEDEDDSEEDLDNSEDELDDEEDIDDSDESEADKDNENDSPNNSNNSNGSHDLDNLDDEDNDNSDDESTDKEEFNDKEDTDESTDDKENNEDSDNDANSDNDNEEDSEEDLEDEEVEEEDSEEDSEEDHTDLDNSNNSEEQEENTEDSEEDLDNSTNEDDEDSEDSEDSNNSENDSNEDNSEIESTEDSEDEEDSENNTEEDSDTDEESNNQEETENNSEANSEDDSEDEDEDEEEVEDEDDPIKDPFADEEDIPTSLSSNNSKEPRDATLDDIIGQLTGLNAESKLGALAAIKDLLAKEDEEANESFKLDFAKKSQLVEALKSVREMTDDEFGDYINGVYDLIDQVEEIEYVDDVEERKSKIKAWADDPMTAQELAAEDNIEIQKDQQAIKASEKEKQKYSQMSSLDEFSIDLFNAIDYQIDLVKQVYLSYDEPNTEYEDSDLIMRTEIEREIPDEAWPIIDIYFDVSGSWTANDIKTGMQAIASIKKFEDAGELIVNVFYWDDQVSDKKYLASIEGGTTGWQKVLANIHATKASNVMIMTDSDISYYDERAELRSDIKEYSAKYGPSVIVDGCVWYLWKNGMRSPECVKKLTGKQGTYQYSF